jgi:hypothetical protein
LEGFLCDLAARALDEERQAGKEIDPLLDALIARRRASLDQADLRKVDWIADGNRLFKEREETQHAMANFSWLSRSLISSATRPHFVGQDHSDRTARREIKITMSVNRRWMPELDGQLARLLAEAFGPSQELHH